MTYTLRGSVWAMLLVLSVGTGALAQSNKVWPERFRREFEPHRECRGNGGQPLLLMRKKR